MAKRNSPAYFYEILNAEKNDSGDIPVERIAFLSRKLSKLAKENDQVEGG